MAEADDFTADPDALESDRTLGSVPRYQFLAEEPGRRKEKAGGTKEPVLRPCATCHRLVVMGQTEHGELRAVEPQTLTFTLAWDRGERWPRLIQSRGYPAHTCPD